MRMLLCNAALPAVIAPRVSVDTYRDRLYELKLPRNFHLVLEGFNARYPQIVKLLLIVQRTIAITTGIFLHIQLDVNSLMTAISV